MANYHHQILMLADAFGTPTELFNGARLARNLQAANLCGAGLFDNILANAGCDGYLYQPTAPTALNDAVLWIDAVDGSPTRQTAPNRGIGGPQLNATLGSSTGVDTTEPLWLGGGEKYLYLPGVAGNYASVPNTASLRITGDIEIISRLALDDWTTAINGVFVASKYRVGVEGYELAINFAALNFSARLAGLNIGATSTATVPFAAGQAGWVRVTRVASTGVINFYSAPDSPDVPLVWSSLGSTTSTAGAIVAGSENVGIGTDWTLGLSGAAKFFRTIVRNTVDATTPTNVLDANFSTNTRQSDFVATAGGTVTIARSSTGRKSVMYQGRPLWLFGTNDYMTIADHPLLDFDLNEPFTVMAIQRTHNVAVGSVQAIISKQTGSAAQGWGLYNGTAATTTGDVHDGAATGTASTGNKTASTLSVVGIVRSVVLDNVTPYLNGTAGTPGTDNTTVASANSQPTRVGGFSAGASPLDAEVMAVLVWRRALSATEMADVSSFYSGSAQIAGQCWTTVDFSAGSNPWYNASLPESSEAYGFYIEEWTGLDGGHNVRSSSPTGRNRGGAYYGPQSHNARTWKLNVILHGSTERGLEYLFRWLEGQLLNNCGTNCGAQHAWIRQVCPTAPETVPQEGVARAERVVLLEGPTYEAPPDDRSGCYIRRVSFTLGVGDPCLYREVAPLAYAEVTTSGTGTGNTLSNCGTFTGSTRRVSATFSGNPGYGANAPVVTITSPAEGSGTARKGLPVLRIAGYLDPNSTGDPCRSNLVGELILEGAETSGYEIVADMARRAIRMRPVGTTTWLDGSRLIGKALRSGVTRWWSFSPCDTLDFVVVEPAFTNLENARTSPSTSLVVSSWTVRIESGVRFGCV